MAFMSILIVMGLFGFALVFLLAFVGILVLGGALLGLLVAHMGKLLSQNTSALASHAGFIKACRVLGRVATGVCGAAILSSVALFIAALNIQGSYVSPAVAVLTWGTLLLVLLGLALFITMGVLLIRIYRCNRRLAQPLAGRALPVVGLVLGIFTFVAGGGLLLVVGALLLLFR